MLSIVIPAIESDKNEFDAQAALDKFVINNKHWLLEMDDIDLLVVSNVELHILCSAGKVLKYPHTPEILNLPKVSNYGIKRADNPIIVKADIDNIFTKDLLQLFQWAISENGGVSPRQVHIENSETLEIVGTFYQSWGCFGLTKANWHQLGGYNERLEGYGQDDLDLCLRVQKKFNVIRGNLPLYHVKHPRRNRFYPNRNKENRLLLGESKWHSKYAWGEG